MDLEPLGQFTRRDWQSETTDGPLRFAMIGLGWWTREKAIPAIQDSEFATTTVAVSGDEEKATRVTARWDTIGCGITYEEFHDGEAVDAYDAVYICTPNALHLPYAESAAEHGAAVLCEKPMEASVDRAEAMVAATRDVPLMIAYRMHTEPAIRRTREVITDGTIGDPVHVQGTMSQPLLDIIPDPNQWRLDPDLAGYGSSVMDIGLYPLNTARFVLDRDPVAVTATTASPSEPFADVPDERAAFLADYEDDVLGSFTVSQNAAQASFLRVTGTDGTVEVSPSFFPWTDRGFELTVGDDVVDCDWDQINQMIEEFDYFSNNVLTGADLHPDGEHGLVDMRTLQAVYEAADRGERVRVESN